MAILLTYPMKTMRITQNYSGTTSHKPHWYGVISRSSSGKATYGTLKGLKDFPEDEGGKDSERDPMYAPCNLVVKKIYGRGNRGVNTIWLESTEKVEFANGTVDYLTMMVTHPNDSDINRLYEGMVIKKGAYVCYEGTDGATGNHLHISVGTGHMSGGGWAQNANGKWVLTVTGKTLKPEEAFYIDPKFTTVKSKGGMSFKTLPQTQSSTNTAAPVKTAKYTTGNYRVETEYLNVRAGAGTKFAVKTFNQMTEAAQAAIKKHNGGKPANSFPKGMVFTAMEIKDNWGRCPSGWLCLDYCKKV